MRVTTVALLAIILLLLASALLLLDYFRQPQLVIVDGEEMIIRGRYDSVSELLEAAGVLTRPEDRIWPLSIDQPPDAETITVQHASSVRLTVDGRQQDVWTHQSHLGSFLAENDVELRRNALIAVDDTPVALSELTETQLGSSVDISHQVDIEIRDGQDKVMHSTGAATVGQALAEAGVNVYSTDQVRPPLGSWLRPGLEIELERAVPVTVLLEVRQLQTRTKKETVAGILAEAGVGLSGTDSVKPNLDQEIGSGETIEILRISPEYQLAESPLAFSSRLQPVETLEIDQRSLLSAGSPGTMSRLIRVEPSNSETLSQTLVGEWVSLVPTDEVVGYGTNIVVNSIETPQGPVSYWRVVKMRATAYTAADAGKPPSHPAYGITASGRPAGFGIVAIDPEVVPFRSQVYVPGYGIGFAGDTGGGVKGRWIDLGYDEGEIVTWNGYVDVYYLTPVPESNQINYLIPSTLP